MTTLKILVYLSHFRRQPELHNEVENGRYIMHTRQKKRPIPKDMHILLTESAKTITEYTQQSKACDTCVSHLRFQLRCFRLPLRLPLLPIYFLAPPGITLPKPYCRSFFTGLLKPSNLGAGCVCAKQARSSEGLMASNLFAVLRSSLTFQHIPAPRSHPTCFLRAVR